MTILTVIAALRWSLFGWSGRGQLTHELMPLLHRRIGAIGIALERLMARFLAGKAMRRGPRAAAAVAGAVETPVVAARRAESIWPREFSWLATLMAHHATCYTGQLELLLAEPQMVALLTASPQAARLLRPMCRMLGVTQSLLRPGFQPVVKPPKELPTEPTKRVRKKRAPIDWGRIPLPRGVLSAARRAGSNRFVRPGEEPRLDRSGFVMCWRVDHSGGRGRSGSP